jgi:hypothetical protein
MTHNEQEERVATALQYRDDLSPNATYEDLARAALDAMGLPSREQVLVVVRAIEWASGPEGREYGGLDEDAAVDDFLALLQIQAPLGEALENPAPQTVTSVEELEALPSRTVVRDAGGYEWLVNPARLAADDRVFFMAITGAAGNYRAERVALPATVLTPATAPTAEQVQRILECGPESRPAWEWEPLAEHIADHLRAAGIEVES